MIGKVAKLWDKNTEISTPSRIIFASSFIFAKNKRVREKEDCNLKRRLYFSQYPKLAHIWCTLENLA